VTQTLDRAGPRAASPLRVPNDGRRRVVVENVTPCVDGGRFPVKRILGDTLTVEADVFADGHDLLDVRLCWRAEGERDWREVPMTDLGNDHWRATFTPESLGRWEYTVTGWVDRLASWQRDLRKRLEAAQDVRVDLLIGAELVGAAADRALEEEAPADTQALSAAALQLRALGTAPEAVTDATGLGAVLDRSLDDAAERHPDRTLATEWTPPLAVTVDRERARFSAWYELFPRSASPDPERHGTFRDVIDRLPYVAQLGFDVLYLPPIHPIGTTFRKGVNNTTDSTERDPGVPWAIGSAEGGHTAIHPQLGSVADLDALITAAREQGIEVALDIAFQASPDHPWVTEHPGWFRHRPDGSVQYAENPPKKYQDIYPFDFETEEWRELWAALEAVFRAWIDRGIRIFRVDNPHTKPFPFWAWLIERLKREHPDVLLLAEAFTRPRVMQRLAKIGFSQSYTYFTWRNTKAELTEYFTELTTEPLVEYFRPNAWPNTPDILHEELQTGGRPKFEARLVLAATLSANYGIYGPAFELGEHEPIQPGSEEYLNSEKYQQRTWDLDRADSLAPLITAVNRTRRDHPALQRNDGLAFHEIDNDQLLAYSKRSDDGTDLVLVVVNLDPRHAQSGTLLVPLESWGLHPDRPVEARDVLTGNTEVWQGHQAVIDLEPGIRQAVVLTLRQLEREHDIAWS
jgi:starch synthase (maltosyl-transferring)